MYAESLLVNRIASETGYNVGLTEDKNIDITAYTGTNPVIAVGHVGIRLKQPGLLWANGYEEIENRQILISEIQILCPRTQLHTVRTNIYNSYKNYSPIDNSEFSSVIFLEASVVAKTGNNIWWIEQVGVVFPQIYLNL